MPLDEARQKALYKLHRDSRELLDSLADRISTESLADLRRLSDASEWTELVNALCAYVVRERVPVAPAERDAFASVLDLFQLPADERFTYVNDAEGTLAALHVVDEPSGEG